MGKWGSKTLPIVFLGTVWLLLWGLSASLSAATQIELTADERQWLADHPEIVLAPDPSFPPVEFFDEQGRYRGIAADIIALIESRLDIRFTVVQLPDWPQILQQTRQGKVDLLGAIVKTPQRDKYLLFTEPFLTFPGVIVVQKGVSATLTLNALRGMTVAIVDGYTGHELIASRYPEIRLEVVPDTPTGLRKVSFGMVDAFVGNLGTASFFLEQQGITNLRIGGETGEVYPWALGVRKDWPQLQTILQKALDSITETERRQIRYNWVQLEKMSVFDRRKFWLGASWVLAGVLVVIGFFWGWNRTLQRQVARRTLELEHAVDEAESARDNVDTILRSVADGLVVANRENQVVLMNRAAELLLETTLEQAYFRPIGEVLWSPDCERYLTQMLRRNARSDTTEWVIEASHLSRTLQARSAVVLNRAGERSRTITIVRDISRERDLDRMKTEFISTAAHELRTPLTAVMGYTELLLHPEEFAVTETGKQKQLLTTIYEKACRLEAIVNDLLDLSRVQSGDVISLQRHDCSIDTLLKKVVTALQQQGIAQKIELRHLDAPVSLWVDDKKLEQVLDNLLANAVKFSPPDSCIYVSGQLSGPNYRISVRDEGIGMSAEQQARMFDKFYRVDSSDTAPGGLGLGMSIVKSIVEAHGGEVWVVSSLGQGTTVSFTLPLLPEVPTPEQQS